MIKQFRYKDIVWLDLESPTADEVKELGQKYDIYPLVLEELTHPSERPRVDVYSDFIYLILHFPQEIDFIIGKHFIITTHYETVNSLNDFAKILETDLSLKKNHGQLHAGFIFYYIIKEIYATLETRLNNLNDRLRTAEEKVFHGEERAMVKKLSEISHELMDLRWTLKTHGEILTTVEVAGEDLFGRTFVYYLKAISSEQIKIWNTLESNRTMFLDLRETNDSLLTIKTNETIKTLTIAAFVLLPMTIIAQLFGIASNDVPVVHSVNGFETVVGLMILSSVLTYLVARFKKWI